MEGTGAMTTVMVECPDDLLAGLRMEPADFADWMRMRAAIDLVNQGKLTTGMAARWLSMERVAFIHAAGGLGLVLLSDRDADLERAVP